MPVYSVRQFGSSCSSGPDSSTAPDNECAPTAEPFSSTQTLRSALSCFSRIAHARPAGPAPTITTSYSITSRSVMASLFAVSARGSCGLLSVLLLRRHPDRAVEADAFAVEHRVLTNVSNQRGVFLGAAQTRRERHLFAERVLRFLRHGGHHRCFEDAGR